MSSKRKIRGEPPSPDNETAARAGHTDGGDLEKSEGLKSRKPKNRPTAPIGASEITTAEVLKRHPDAHRLSAYDGTVLLGTLGDPEKPHPIFVFDRNCVFVGAYATRREAMRAIGPVHDGSAR